MAKELMLLTVYAHVPLICGTCEGGYMLNTQNNEVRCENERCPAFGRVFEFPAPQVLSLREKVVTEAT